jgi:hypothetical protein
MCRVGVLSGTGETCPQMPGNERGTRVARGRVCGMPCRMCQTRRRMLGRHGGVAEMHCGLRVPRPSAATPGAGCGPFRFRTWDLRRRLQVRPQVLQSVAWSLCVDPWGRDRNRLELAQPETPCGGCARLRLPGQRVHAQHGALRLGSQPGGPKRMREPQLTRAN